MKKIILYFVFSLALFNSYSSSKLINSEMTQLKEIYVWPKNIKNTITYKELENDLDFLFYYISQAYVGYEEMKLNGYDEEKIDSFIKNKYQNQENIFTKDVYEDIYKVLFKYIIDRHFTIYDHNALLAISACKNLSCLLTNTFVNEYENKYYVCETDSSYLKVGDEYIGDKKCLFYYPSKGTSIYRIGKFVSSELSNEDFLFNKGNISLKLYDDGVIQYSPTIKYHDIETKGSVYVSLSSFVLPPEDSKYRKGADLVLEKFSNIGSKWYKKQNIIIDLRSNVGGRAVYGEYAIWSLYDKKHSAFSYKTQNTMYKFLDSTYFETTTIESPATVLAHLKLFEITDELNTTYGKIFVTKMKKMQKNPQKNTFAQTLENKTTEFSSNYDGKLVFLIDRNTLSASETMVLIAKKIIGPDKVIVIGENSGGCAKYWDVMDYYLPNTGISISLCSSKNDYLENNPCWYGEGAGIFPDYWSTGQDLNETIFLVTQDEEMKQKLKGISSRLM